MTRRGMSRALAPWSPMTDLGDIRALAVGGLVSTTDAVAAGLDRRALADLARRGELVRVSHGHYLVDPEVAPEQHHRLRAVASLRRLAGAGASHHTGLLLHQLPTFRADLTRVHVTSATERKRAPDGTHHWLRRSVVLEEISLGPHTVPVLPVATCVVQAGLLRGAESALVSADAALRAEVTTTDALASAVEEAAGYRGVRAVRRALEWADARHESPGESRTAFALHRLGHAFTPQVWIGNDRVDALLDEHPVVIEFDGRLKYATPADLVHEKRREDRIRARGYGFVRPDWGDLYDLMAFGRAIHRAISLR